MLYCMFLSGCYTPIGYFTSIGITDSHVKQTLYSSSANTMQNTIQPFLFYKECSRNGANWLYECQNIGITSLYHAIVLESPQTKEIQDIQMFFHPRKTYIRFEIYDSNLIH